MAEELRLKTIVVGAGPVGALAALYAAARGEEVEIYELRAGKPCSFSLIFVLCSFYLSPLSGNMVFLLIF